MGPTTRVHRVLAGVRRRRAIARIRAEARLAGAALDLRIAPTARVGRMHVRFTSARPARFHIGEHTVVDDDVEVRLDGGSVRIGDWSEIRGGVRLMASGDLDAQGQNLLSWGMVVHCDERVTLARQSTFGEYVTIADSVHEHSSGAWHLDHIRTAPVLVGTDTWVGAKATITAGVTVGEHCVVAGSAVVTRDVPDHHVAMGVPATTRPLDRSTQIEP